VPIGKGRGQGEVVLRTAERGILRPFSRLTLAIRVRGVGEHRGLRAVFFEHWH
jgi:hypothetical protein